MPKIVYVRGGDKTAPGIAKASGMAYGSRNDYKIYDPDVFMIDIIWEHYNWQRYLKKIAAYKPTVAMVPDWLPGIPASLIYQQINDLESLGVPHIMVCPKFPGAVAEIDRKYIIALSVPTSYAGFLPSSLEMTDRRAHLLGGHPDQQAYCIHERYHNAEIVTTDTNILGLKARFACIWHADTGDWNDLRNKGTDTIANAIASALEIQDYLHRPRPHWNTRKPRLQRCIEFSARLF